jgi:ABC-type nitrate/sulfonate/bicarbonate transport system substrate-binding protein
MVIAANSACSLSRRERGGVRGYKLSINPNPLTPTLSTIELGYTRVRSLNDVAEVGNIRLRLGRGSSAVPRFKSVLNFLAVMMLVMSTSLLPATAAEELRVGVSIPAAVAFVPLQVGIERGIFAKHDLVIKRSDLGGAARAHQALAAGSLDIVVAGGPDLSLVAKGQHALAVGVITVAPRQTTLIVRNDNPMKTPAELQGKRVGISTAGGLSEWVVRQLSRQLGFGATGITAVGLGRDEAQVASLRAGQIDATVMDFASGLRLEELGVGRIFLKVSDYVPKMVAQAVYAGNDVIAKRPQAVREFLSGWYEAVASMRADKTATIAIAARQMDVSAILAGKVYDELIENYSRDGRFDPEGLRVLVDSLVEMGALKSADVKALYTEQYLPPP